MHPRRRPPIAARLRLRSSGRTQFALAFALAVAALPVADMSVVSAQQADAGSDSSDGVSSDGTDDGSGNGSAVDASDGGSPTLEESAASADSSAVDAGGITLMVLGASVVTVLLVLLLRPRSARPTKSASASPGGWRKRVEWLCVEGRATVDLTDATDGTAPGTGLSLEQLRIIEGRADLLIAELHDVELQVRSDPTRQQLRIAESHAQALKDLVQTERRIKLGSLSPNESLLDATATQLVLERTALDRSLTDLSAMVVSSQ